MEEFGDDKTAGCPPPTKKGGGEGLQFLIYIQLQKVSASLPPPPPPRQTLRQRLTSSLVPPFTPPHPNR